MFDSHDNGMTPEILRETAKTLEVIYKQIGYTSGGLDSDDWRWGFRCTVWVDESSVGQIRAHHDGYLAFFTDEEKND